jgi:hypothetical protein
MFERKRQRLRKSERWGRKREEEEEEEEDEVNEEMRRC